MQFAHKERVLYDDIVDDFFAWDSRDLKLRDTGTKVKIKCNEQILY